MAKKTTGGPKAAAGTNATARKKDSGGKLAAAAETVGRTLGRAAKVVDKVRAAVKKSSPAKRGKNKAQDPAAVVKRVRDRELWKSRSEQATSAELAKHAAVVDERARARAATGARWANRKPR